MMMKYFYLVIFMVMLFILTITTKDAIAENRYITSDTSTVNKYIKLSFEDKAFVPFVIYNSLEALELAKKIKYNKGIDNIYELRIWNDELGIKKATYNLRFILNNDINLSIILFDSLGYYYVREGQLDKAINCFRRAEALVENVRQQENRKDVIPEALRKSVLDGIAVCYKKIGNKYFSMQAFEISLEYQNKALSIYKGLNNKIGIASCYNNLGISYINIGNNFLGLDYLLKALKIA